MRIVDERLRNGAAKRKFTIECEDGEVFVVPFMYRTIVKSQKGGYIPASLPNHLKFLEGTNIIIEMKFSEGMFGLKNYQKIKGISINKKQ